jgi:hypothetical protein
MRCPAVAAGVVLLASVVAANQVIAQVDTLKVDTLRPVLTPRLTLRPTITLVEPNGGESWEIGRTYTIRWTSERLQHDVTVDLCSGSRCFRLTGGQSKSGSYSYTVDSFLDAGDYKIEVYEKGKAAVDRSDGNFSIARPAVDLTCMLRVSPSRESFSIWVRNNGTRIVDAVLFDWLITRSGSGVVEQHGAGFGRMYPDRWYSTREGYSFDMPRRVYVVEVFVDPDNRNGEAEALRADNHCEAEVDTR